METKDKQALTIYCTNLIGNYIPKIGSCFNPLGSILFGGLNLAKRIHKNVDNSYARLFETLGGAYYVTSAISNILSSFDGNFSDLGAGILDASMAYQLMFNEGIIENIRSGRTEKDINHVKNSLEKLLKDKKQK